MPRIVLIAGELSGDRLGAGLIRALRKRRSDLRFAGIAGPAMEAAGCEAWHPSESLAVMGLAEVVRHLPRLYRVHRDVRQRLRTQPPDLLVGIDAPDFNLRIERFARRHGIRTAHYVSPSVWAWRPGRVRTIRAACDHVLCLLPFEADFLARHDIHATFVGHPLADELPVDPDRAAARRALGLVEQGQCVALLPGSRVGEVERLGPVFAQVAAQLRTENPGLQFVAPMATDRLRRLFAAHLSEMVPAGAVALVDGRSHAAMAAADVVLLASGTATLEALLLQRPMVVAYRLSLLTYRVLDGLRLVKVEHFALPNLLAGRQVVGEYLQDAATPAALASEVGSLLKSPQRREEMRSQLAGLRASLRRGADAAAAGVVLELLAGGAHQPPAAKPAGL